MARMQGITGKLSGKMGAAVFRVREGQQVVTQYNPIVKNPNTAGQQAQRAKFKLMSQLAAVMAPGYGTMGTINRPTRGKGTQRNAFTQINMKLVEVDRAGQEVTAKIPMEKVLLTSSFRNLPQPSLTAGAGSFEIEMENISADVTTIRVVVVEYVDNIPAINQMMDIPVNKNTHSFVQEFANMAPGNYTVLAYGLIPSESAKANIDLDNIHTPEDQNFISAVNLNAMVAEGSMAETKTTGANIVITQA